MFSSMLAEIAGVLQRGHGHWLLVARFCIPVVATLISACSGQRVSSDRGCILSKLLPLDLLCQIMDIPKDQNTKARFTPTLLLLASRACRTIQRELFLCLLPTAGQSLRT
jgi:hypothetical protein